jgi:hypothetical protein
MEQIPDGEGEHAFRTNVADLDTTPVIRRRMTGRDLVALTADEGRGSAQPVP